MSNPITTANGVTALAVSVLRPDQVTSVLVQGDANDFVWSLMAKADSSLSFINLPNLSGITGAKLIEFRPTQDTEYQVKVTNLGTATSVYVRSN